MPALFEEGSGLGADEPHPLVLVDQRSAGRCLRFRQLLTLALQVERRELIGGLLRQPGLASLPELGFGEGVANSAYYRVVLSASRSILLCISIGRLVNVFPARLSHTSLNGSQSHRQA